MQVKVFESQDMTSGLKMVKEALGPDALILSTKTVRSKKLGLLGKSHFEITAAVDDMWPHKGGTLSNQGRNTSTAGLSDRELLLSPQNVSKPEPGITYTSAMQFRDKPENTPSSAIRVPKENTSQTPASSHLQDEVKELKEMVKNLGQEMLRINRPSDSEAVPAEPSPTTNSSDSRLQALQRRLLEYGISTETVHTITNFAKETLTLEDISDPFKQKHFVQKTVAELLHEGADIFSKEKRQHRIALVGPTGVGKTTTLAKIAADFLTTHSSKIGFITIDTYRIAAVEQLKVYGDIMDIPVEVVLNPDQMEQALLNMRDKDLILIDTAGRSPKDGLCIEELATFLRPDLSIQKHLVLSATTREQELFDAIDRFSILGLDYTIITKIDECVNLGLLLDIQIREKIPFSYITNGQRVPEDIIEASRETLTELIMAPGKGLPYE